VAICGPRETYSPYDDHVGMFHGKHQIEAGFWAERVQANDPAQTRTARRPPPPTKWLAASSSKKTFPRSRSSLRRLPWIGVRWNSLVYPGTGPSSARIFDLRIGFRFESTDGWNEVARRADEAFLERRHSD
jgi:hypothetical protein